MRNIYCNTRLGKHTLEQQKMPLQRQSSVCSYDNEVFSGSFEGIEPTSSPTHGTGSSSWKLLRNLFAASRSFSVGKDKHDSTSSTGSLSPKKHRRVSTDQNCNSEKHSPSGLRRLSVVARKCSTSKSPTMKGRKFSSVNSQENQLHYLVSESDVQALKIILTTSTKVDINFMRTPGLSPLHTACILGDLDIVELLVNHGADINLRTWSGLSPLQITTLFGHFDVAQYLISHGVSCKEIQNGFTTDTKLISTMLCIN